MRYSNWPNTMIGVFGGMIIADLFRLSDISIFPWLSESVVLWFSIIILLIGVFLLIFKYYVLKKKLVTKIDERENAISDRSARNGLLVTYFALLVLLVLHISLNARSLLIVIGVGLIVWVVSFPFYTKKLSAY
jgi:predicted histidine transporter YuiF (NhaC family)